MRPREERINSLITQTTGEIGSARRAPARIRAAADGGWMSEKHPLLAE